MIVKTSVCALPLVPKVKSILFSFFKLFLGLDPQKSLQTLIEMVKQYRTKHAEEEAL